MFNKKPINGIYRAAFLLLLMVFASCVEEAKISFEEEAIASVEGAEITILYPEAKGNSLSVPKINEVVSTYDSSVPFVMPTQCPACAGEIVHEYV